MKRFGRTFALAALAACGVLHLTCGSQRMAGGTSETTNGFVAVVRTAGGLPLAHAIVRLRPEGYLSDTAGAPPAYDSASVVDTFTDADGRFRITGIDTGRYCIEIQNGAGEAALLRAGALNDSVVDCGSAILEPAGGVRGTIDRATLVSAGAVYVRIYGLERIAKADSASGAFAVRYLPRGELALYVAASSPSYAPREIRASVARDTVIDVGGVSLFPYNGWAYAKRLGLNTASSGAATAGSVYGFPLLVRLQTGNFAFGQARADGGDLRFTKSDSTPLPFEIERWDAAGGRAEIWVKIDTVAGNSDRQSIIMFWGNAQAGAPASHGAVFDTAAGFQGVWHLGDAAGDSIRDATSNGYCGVSPDSGRPPAAEGIIGNCRRFDGAADFITVPNTANGKLNFQQNGDYMVCAWVLLDTFDNASHCIVSKGYEQYYLRSTYISKNVPSAAPLWEFVEFSETDKWQTSTSPAAGRQWTLLVGVRQGQRQLLYCNGVLQDSTVDTWFNTVSRNTGNDLTFGRFAKPVTVPISEGYCYFKGAIDEVRICGVVRSADWIKLCYMNQRPDDKLVVFK
jgi:hypothetical protein